MKLRLITDGLSEDERESVKNAIRAVENGGLLQLAQATRPLSTLTRAELEDALLHAVRFAFDQFEGFTALAKLVDMDHLQSKAAEMHKRLATMGATARLRNDHDGKQAAKVEAFKLWQARRAGRHPKLRRNEDFASECQRRWPVLTSVKSILGWCSRWEKEARRKESQPAS